MRSRKKNGGHILVECLYELGIKTVFMVPGESYLTVLDGFYDYRTKIKTITCRHESSASNMAEAYGKITKSPGITFVTRGPGACHASVGVHTAMQDSTPMILFIGQITSKNKGKEAFQEVEYKNMFAPPFCKWVHEINNTEEIPKVINEAYKISMSGRPGPVVIALPEDFLEKKISYKTLKLEKINLIQPKDPSIEAVISILTKSSKPLIIAGGGDWDKRGAEDLVHFAEKNKIPIAVSFRRQALVDNNSPSYIGDLSTSVDTNLIKYVKRSDLILVVGARLGEMTTKGYTTISVKGKSKIIHVYPESKEIGKVYTPIIGIRSNSSEFSKKLRKKVIKNVTWEKWTKTGNYNYRLYSTPPQYKTEPNMGKIIAHLKNTVPSNTIVTIDAGNFSGWIQRFWTFSKPNTQLAPTSGAMGYAIPAAIAAKIAKSNTQVIGFCGDGGFMMSCQELATANQYGVKLVIIVINNNMLGTIRMHQEIYFPQRTIGTDLINPDYKLLAEAYNFHNEKVKLTREFPHALERALNSHKASLIEIQIDPDQITTNKRIDELKKYKI